MDRRSFLSAAGAAGAALGTSGLPLAAQSHPAPVHPALAALRPRQAPQPISEAERAARRDRALSLMRGAGMDGVLIEPGSSLRYFAGINWGRSERVFGLLMRAEGEPVVISPAFEAKRAEEQVGGRFEIRAWQEDESPAALIDDVVRGGASGARTLGLDPEARYFIADRLRADAPALRVTSAAAVVNGTRGIKSAHEIEIMRFANEVALEAWRAGVATLSEGMTQAGLAGNIREAYTRLGYGAGAWVLALFGESSAYPHGLEQPRALARGDVVLLDLGTNVHGYQSDVTRTITFGDAAPDVVRVFEAVRLAQAEALAAARPGRTAGEIDAVARAVIDEAGYGPDYAYFTHRLGHGIGMDGHEWPYLVRGSDVVLEPGMTFSDEPGIYQYGRFGVRLEDIMAITPAGAELLTPAARSLAG